MGINLILVTLSCYLMFVTSVGEECKFDTDCVSGEFCYEKNYCSTCGNCTADYNREEGHQCAKSSDDCGKCIPGYYEDEDDIWFGELRPKNCRKVITTTEQTTRMHGEINPTTIHKEPLSTVVPITEDTTTTGNNPIKITVIVIGIISIVAVIGIVYKRKRIPGILKSFVSRNQTDNDIVESENLTTSPDIQANDVDTNRLTHSIPATNPRKTENINQRSRPFEYVSVPVQYIVNGDEAQPQQHTVNIPDNSRPVENIEVPEPITNINLAQPTLPCCNTPPTDERRNSGNDYQPEGIYMNNSNHLQSRQNVIVINNIFYQPSIPKEFTNEASNNNISEFSSSASLPNSQISTETLPMIHDNYQ